MSITVGRTAKEKRVWLRLEKSVSFFLLYKGFFYGYLLLKIIGLGGKSGTKKTVPKLADFRHLFGAFYAVCAVI